MQARALHTHHQSTHIVKVGATPVRRGSSIQDGPQSVQSQSDSIQDIAEDVWSSMVQKVIQQDARAKRFDEIWPSVLDKLILKGLSGTC